MIGAIIIVVGLYSVVWGKSKDQRIIASEKVVAPELPVVWDSQNKSNGNVVDEITDEPTGKSNGAVEKVQIEDP